MLVHRERPLSAATNRGRLVVPASVANHTLAALQGFRDARGPHEGLVYWAGRRCGDDALVLAAILPVANHGPQHVLVDEREVARMSRRARAMGLAVIAQVHSHPGTDTRHSDGDDTLVLMPFEGMYSLVVAQYGHGAIQPAAGAGLHQYQDRRWVRVPPDCHDAMVVVPTLIETVT